MKRWIEGMNSIAGRIATLSVTSSSIRMEKADLSGAWTCIFLFLNWACAAHGNKLIQGVALNWFLCFCPELRHEKGFKVPLKALQHSALHINRGEKEIFPLGFDRRHTAKCQCDSRLLHFMGFKPFFIKEDSLTVVTTLCSRIPCEVVVRVQRH